MGPAFVVPALIAAALIAAASVAQALTVWPAAAETAVAHRHRDLPPDHPHLKEHGGNADHRHPAMADDLHTWRVTP